MASVSVPVAPPERSVLGLSYEWLALIVVLIGAFMEMLDTTVVNIALPRIITVFSARVDAAQFVLTGYMIALAIIMPASGYLSDTFGTKRIYLQSMFLFVVGSLLCSLSWDVTSLVFFRVLQGLGGGMLSPLGMSLLFKTVPPERRGFIMSIFGLPLLFAPVIGPTLGGYIVQYIDWRFIFTLNLPVGALGLLLGLVLLRETDRHPGLRFDLRGFLLSAVGFGALFYGLSQAPDWGWADPRSVGFIGGAVIMLIAWVMAELNHSQPLLELRVFRDHSYALATCVNFVVTVAMYASILLMPLFLQNFRGLGAMDTGLIMFPQALAAGLVMPISGRLFDKIGPRPLILSGLLLLAYATWQLRSLDVTTPDMTIRGILIMRGVSMGLIMMPAMTVAMNSLPRHLISRGSSLTNVLRQLFGSFGTAIFVTLLQTRQTYHQAMLSQTMTPDVPGVRGVLEATQHYLMHQGMTSAQAKATGVLYLLQQVALQAAVLSFEDCFLIAAGVCLLALIPAMFLRSTGTRREGAATLD